MKTIFDENQVLNMMELIQVRGGDGDGSSGEPGNPGEDIVPPPPDGLD